MTFDMQPSPEFARLTARWNELRKRRLDLELSAAEQQRVLAEMAAVSAALQETPEQQYLDQIRADELEAWDQENAAELARRGRMASVLALSPEGKDLDYAITNHEFSSIAHENDVSDPLCVIADMRRMSAAQVAKCLRVMADHIEEDGMVVYRGRCPAFWNKVEPGDRWWVDEKVDGTFRHSRSRRD